MKKISSLLIPLLVLCGCSNQEVTSETKKESSTEISLTDTVTSSSVESSTTSEVSSSSIEESSSGDVVPYTITFTCDEHVNVYVYATQDYTATPTLATTAYAVDGDTGANLSDGNGQVNFKVVIDEGYAIDGGISVVGEYKNLKTPDETETENVYRITKIASNLTVTINTIATEAQSYTVTFVCDEHVTVYAYTSKDYTVEPSLATSAKSVDDNGVETRVDGQVNFKVVFEEGYTLDSMSHDEKNYKNLKGPADTEVENVYRLTKITGDFTLTITSKVVEETE